MIDEFDVTHVIYGGLLFSKGALVGDVLHNGLRYWIAEPSKKLLQERPGYKKPLAVPPGDFYNAVHAAIYHLWRLEKYRVGPVRRNNQF